MTKHFFHIFSYWLRRYSIHSRKRRIHLIRDVRRGQKPSYSRMYIRRSSKMGKRTDLQKLPLSFAGYFLVLLMVIYRYFVARRQRSSWNMSEFWWMCLDSNIRRGLDAILFLFLSTPLYVLFMLFIVILLKALVCKFRFIIQIMVIL